MSKIFSNIVVAGQNPVEVERGLSQLKANGFKSVYGTTSLKDTERMLDHQPCQLCFVDATWSGEYNSGLTFLKSARSNRHQCAYVLLTSDPSLEQFYLGALSGFRDYLVKNRKLNLGKESLRLLDSTETRISSWHNCQAINELGFFRSLGLTHREIDILVEYARDFPRHRELSLRLKKSTPQLRKTFSTIYGKLSHTLAVESGAQLAHLLTIAVFYRSTNCVLQQ